MLCAHLQIRPNYILLGVTFEGLCHLIGMEGFWRYRGQIGDIGKGWLNKNYYY